MTASILASTASGLRLALISAMLLGPLVTLGAMHSNEVAVAKRGAGLLLFVSLQRQSMS
ncbi:hypothetical protein [Rhizobium sp. RU36D]|uniref:hypothetical protein n=1 Tax=Rhizobium sp. RU36D TaxID=1907415 RepID=UPI0009D8DCD9|nr:hypothetical protein [Rhizobium sp. RU36D]SMD11271.1 hypothetical protein SAMN05880593_12285 [Rhizobium sp. RU36D]